MFKRFAATFLTVLYLITATGFALNFHYCGKLLTAIKIDAPAKGCNDGMAAKMKCCKDKQLIIKIKDVHQTAVNFALAKIPGFVITKFPFAGVSFSTTAFLTSTAFDGGPPDPPLSSTRVFIKNCSFRI